MNRFGLRVGNQNVLSAAQKTAKRLENNHRHQPCFEADQQGNEHRAEHSAEQRQTQKIFAYGSGNCRENRYQLRRYQPQKRRHLNIRPLRVKSKQRERFSQESIHPITMTNGQYIPDRVSSIVQTKDCCAPKSARGKSAPDGR